MDNPDDIVNRKVQHVRTVMGLDVDHKQISTGLENYRFLHQALPEIDYKDIDTKVSFFSKKLTFPIIISSMTGGWVDDDQTATVLNKSLAQAAQKFGIGMGVGSQRVALQKQDLGATYRIRDVAPDILLFANLGAVQLNYGYGVDECVKAVEMIEADALILHLNPLQEYFQINGDTNWKDLTRKIELVCKRLPVPVIAKEVGWGISPQTAQRLFSSGVSAIDVGGSGGTPWSEVEKHTTSYIKREVAEVFHEWGIPTAESIIMVRNELGPDYPIIASGGIRNGIDVAKSIALGADLAGVARPLVGAAWDGVDGVSNRLEVIIEALKATMFAAGIGNIAQLKKGERIVKV